jgi:hopene-associated glycosyltransferase HpnB
VAAPVTLLAALAALAWLYLMLLHGRFWSAGPVLPEAAPRAAPSVSIVVPARDEAATIAPVLRSLLAQRYAGDVRVVLVDDNSTDDTGAIARAIGDARLTVLTGQARPAGWAGKLWAVHQGVAATRSDWLLLTDADIIHEPAHLASLLAHAEANGCGMVSEMVALNCDSLPERLLVPAFVYFFQLLYPFARVNNPRSTVAAAAGGTVLIRRAVLEQAGGVAAIRGALIDDVALATAVKRHAPIWLGHSALARSVRPYPAFADIWRMVARSAYVQLRHSPFLLAGTVAGLVLIFLLPPLAAVFAGGGAGWPGALGWGLMTASFLPTLRRFRLGAASALLLPLAAMFYMAATLGSAWDHHRGRGVQWKQRRYTEGRA